MVALAMGGFSLARPSNFMTDEQLRAKSDLIVIAVPKSVRDMYAETTFPGIQQNGLPVEAAKMEADFEIVSVLKGAPPAGNKLTLDYLREVDASKLSVNGPSLVSFNPRLEMSYRLCLRREESGHYTPITGQTDAAFSIVPWK
ncbi:hypothetical protein BH09VER1_BH09VER1_44290 [soil metagenome]